MERMELKIQQLEKDLQDQKQAKEKAVRERDTEKQAREKADRERDTEKQAREKADRERDNADRARDNADRARDNADRARDSAEQQSRKTTLYEYLDAVHVNYSWTLSIQTNKTKATKGDPSNATDKLCPTKIEAWDGFAKNQEAIWEDLHRLGKNVQSSRVFSSLGLIKENGAFNSKKLMASEKDLEFYARLMIQDPVSMIMDHLSEDPDIKKKWHLNGAVSFENHSNTLNDDTELDARMEMLNIESTNASSTLKNTDQILVHQVENEKSIPCFIVEYKAPHKLTIAHIKAGLGPINPLKDIVNNPYIPSNKDDEAEYRARELVAAVVTQTFSYMIEAGLEFAYICTGEAIVFLQVRPEDPTTVYYHLINPNRDVGQITGWKAESNESNQLRLTTVAQVLVFTLQALKSRPQSSDWIQNATSKLARWKVDPAELLDQIPETVRKEFKEKAGWYRHRPTVAIPRDPHRYNLRPRPKASGCKPDETVNDGDSSDDDEDNDGTVSTPSRAPSKVPGTSSGNQGASKRTTASSKDSGTSSGNQDASKPTTTKSFDEWYERIEQCRAMAYCTQRCLRGLLTGGLLDEQCPNVETHRKRDNNHCLDPIKFCGLMRKQLSKSTATDCHALDMQGSRGALFKIRLTTHGYTVAAKCTVWAYISDLLHEAKVYKQLEEIQGIHIPVCLGNIDLPNVLAYNTVQFVHMMFLSWGGQCMDLHSEISKQPHVMGQAVEAIQAIHQLGVLHRDPMPRNILWCEEVQRVMFIDFERSEIKKVVSKRPLMPSTGNEQKMGKGGGSLTDWRKDMGLKKKLKAKDKVKANASTCGATADKAKLKQPPLTDFAHEIEKMKRGIVGLTQ